MTAQAGPPWGGPAAPSDDAPPPDTPYPRGAHFDAPLSFYMP